VKVLSIDDSSIMRKIISKAVLELGFEFLEAENGHKGIEILSAESQDVGLILLDWNIPGQDGLTTLQEIKKDSRFSHIPVMMVTTEAEKNNILKAVQSGASHYVTKPFTQEDLMNGIKQCLGKGSQYDPGLTNV
jgi:two-component system, chemotaxis family, chemotaxis protein CheY